MIKISLQTRIDPSISSEAITLKLSPKKVTMKDLRAMVAHKLNCNVNCLFLVRTGASLNQPSDLQNGDALICTNVINTTDKHIIYLLQSISLSKFQEDVTELVTESHILTTSFTSFQDDYYSD